MGMSQYNHRSRPAHRVPVKPRARRGARVCLPKRAAIAIAVCVLLGGTGPVWAACNGVSFGTVTPYSGDAVTCTLTNILTIENTAASDVTVTVDGAQNGGIKPG